MLFRSEEMQRLWDHAGDKKWIDATLIQCYSGWRPQEIGLIELKNVDLTNWVFMGGGKTAAGINRMVPIHSKIRDLVVEKCNEAEMLGSKYFFNYVGVSRKRNDTMFTYKRFQHGFEQIKDELNLNPDHRPHDGRTHFVTTAKRYGVDEYAIKYIVGHAVSDLTEKTYTKRNLEWLKEEIEKIK